MFNRTLNFFLSQSRHKNKNMSTNSSVEEVGTDPEDDIDDRPCDRVAQLPPMPDGWAGHPPPPVRRWHDGPS